MRSEGECANPIGRWSVPIDLCVCVWCVWRLEVVSCCLGRFLWM